MSRKMAVGLFALVVGSFLGGPGAHATLSWSATVGGVPIGDAYANFDSLPLGATGGRSGGIGVSFTGGGEAVKGTVLDRYVAPYLSNDNGALFGDPSNGPDTTTYLTTGLGSVTLSFPGPENYIGLLWGSVDPYNTLNFYNGTMLVGSVTGSQITPTADGNQGINGTYYVNIKSTVHFDIVVAESSAWAFEFDNIAYFDPITRAIPIPEPTMLAVLGVGLTGLGFARRRRVV